MGPAVGRAQGARTGGLCTPPPPAFPPPDPRHALQTGRSPVCGKTESGSSAPHLQAIQHLPRHQSPLPNGGTMIAPPAPPPPPHTHRLEAVLKTKEKNVLKCSVRCHSNSEIEKSGKTLFLFSELKCYFNKIYFDIRGYGKKH